MIKKFIYNQKVAPYIFILPFLVIFCCFFIYPMISTIVMSFQDVKPGVTEWVGLANFERLFGDKVFFKALGNSFLYMVLTLVLLIPFPMLFACMINSKLMKAPGLFKSLMYLQRNGIFADEPDCRLIWHSSCTVAAATGHRVLRPAPGCLLALDWRQYDVLPLGAEEYPRGAV